MERKELFATRIMRILDDYAYCMQDFPANGMPQPEFAAIVEKWHLSTGFLKVILGKSDATIESYKYREDKPITGKVAQKIRQLDFMLAAITAK